MTFNKYIVFGYTYKTYHTHTHIHEAFYHALKYLGKDVEWLDEADDLKNKDFSNCFIITDHTCCQRIKPYWPWEDVERKSDLPIRDDSFYCVHGMHDDAEVNELFKNHKYNLCWNVLTMRAMRKGLRMETGPDLVDEIYLDEDVPFSLPQKYMEFRWATNLLPHEIEANKPKEMLSLKNKIIHWVGTIWWVNSIELYEFKKACEKDGVEFNHIGGGQKGVVSNEENQRLIRESWMAPSISGSHHLTEGYTPCRLFKNISYGQMGITNNRKSWELFYKKLIFNPDPYELYFQAKEMLQDYDMLNRVRELMDIVSKKHTYLNRLNVLFTAAEMIMQ